MTEKPASQARRSPTQGRAKATVTAIRQAAAQVLTREGYERATTNRIAVVAGVSIGTLYQYYDGREAIFDAVVDEVLDGLVEACRVALATSRDDLEAQTGALARAALGALAAHPGVLRQLDAIPGSSFRAKLVDAKARGHGLLAGLVAAHRPDKGEADRALATRVLVDVAEGLVFNLRADDDLDRLSAEVARLVLAYVRS
jgi:AcrR family transcriptional regulator